MKFKVSLTWRAEQDRESAFNWYSANYSKEFAVRWFNGITRAIRSLDSNPERCPRAHENDRVSFDLYELHYGQRHNKHRILFRINRDAVIVLHRRHSARRDLTEDDL